MYHPFPYHRDNTIFKLSLRHNNEDSAILFVCELADDKGRIVKGISLKQNRYEVPYPVTRKQADELLILFSCKNIPNKVELRGNVRPTAIPGINIAIENLQGDVATGYIDSGIGRTGWLPSKFEISLDSLNELSQKIKDFYFVNPLIDGDSILSPFNPQPKEELDVIVDNINKYKQEQKMLANSKKWWQFWL